MVGGTSSNFGCGVNGNLAATQALVDRQVAYNKAPFSMAITADGYEHIFGVRVSS